MYEFYLKIRTIFNEVDPFGVIDLEFSDNEDEYDIEILPVLSFLTDRQSTSIEELSHFLINVFKEKTEQESDQLTQDIKIISQRILALKLPPKRCLIGEVDMEYINAVLSTFNILNSESPQVSYSFEVKKIHDLLLTQNEWDDMKLGYQIKSIFSENYDKDLVENLNKDVFFKVASEILKDQK